MDSRDTSFDQDFASFFSYPIVKQSGQFLGILAPNQRFVIAWNLEAIHLFLQDPLPGGIQITRLSQSAIFRPYSEHAPLECKAAGV